MRLPENLENAIDEVFAKTKPSKSAQKLLTDTYKAKGTSPKLFEQGDALSVYLATRVPSIFGAISNILNHIKEEIPGFTVESLLDLGAGPGTASWATIEAFPELKQLTLIEKSRDAIEVGKKIGESIPILKKASWIESPLEKMEAFGKADLAIASYVLRELKSPETLLRNLWKEDIPYLLIVEPGTPDGFKIIRKAREDLLALGAIILAPCPHPKSCPMREGDWCHFSARIERTRLHKHLKGGTLGYEDEKYSYLFVSKNKIAMKSYSRILRHPQKSKGHVRLTLCSSEGNWEEKVVSKKNSSYRCAKKAVWGDPFYSENGEGL